jgi:GNAT superfamily N-acetyltransferase
MSSEPVSSTNSIDQEKAIAVLTLAFSSDAATRWAWPDPHRFLEVFPSFARAMGGAAFAHGTADYLPDYVGAALWFPPSVRPDEEALIDLTQRTVDDSRHEQMFGLFEQMGKFHPHEPHWYLPLIGVDPAHQNKGHGASLMQLRLDACDRDGLPAYLESSDPRNIPFYERLGFKVLGKIQAGSSPTITPMVRRPR